MRVRCFRCNTYTIVFLLLLGSLNSFSEYSELPVKTAGDLYTEGKQTIKLSSAVHLRKEGVSLDILVFSLAVGGIKRRDVKD